MTDSRDGDDPVPYDMSKWEEIVADLSDDDQWEVPEPPPTPAPPPPPVWSDGDTFIPPEPPPLPKGDLISRLAWGGVIAGPAGLLLGFILPGAASSAVVGLGVLAFLAGFITLVVRAANPPREGWDDGSAL